MLAASRARSLAGLLCIAAALAASAPSRAAECAAAPLPREGFAAVVQRNAPAVVQVVVLRGGRDPMEEAEGIEFFQPMQGGAQPVGDALERTFSSGFFIDPDGLLLASAHAVFDARTVWVVTAAGARLQARVVGMDRRRDVALLKVDATGMPVVHVAGAPTLCQGAWVVAMGSPFGFDRTVTAGIVSAYPRYLHGSNIPLIQSDVVMNPGSSGGPLFDASGTLAGMSTMIFSSTGIYVGMSFALPVQELMHTAALLRRGEIASAGDVGVVLQPITADLARAFGLDMAAGALVVRVDEQGAAARAGLRVGDVVLGSAHERLPFEQIESRIESAQPGSTMDFDVWREQAVRMARIRVRAADAQPLPQQAVVPAHEPRLGMSLAVMKARAAFPGGLYVESATGAALLAGLERGDRVVAVNSSPVANLDEFDAALVAAGARPVIALLVARGNTVVYVPVTQGR